MWKYQDKLEKSKLDEQSFIRAVNRIDMKAEVAKSTERQDMHQHIDLLVTWSNGKQMTTDVKGDFGYSYYQDGQKIQKNDGRWVELVSVTGKRGWVDGDAQTIAFRRSESWIIVNRQALSNLVKAKIKGQEISNVKTGEFYRPYRRNGRLDVICLVPWTDIESLKHLTLPTGD